MAFMTDLERLVLEALEDDYPKWYDSSRLVLADLLEENGDPRAHWVRHQLRGVTPCIPLPCGEDSSHITIFASEDGATPRIRLLNDNGSVVGGVNGRRRASKRWATNLTIPANHTGRVWLELDAWFPSHPGRGRICCSWITDHHTTGTAAWQADTLLLPGHATLSRMAEILSMFPEVGGRTRRRISPRAPWNVSVWSVSPQLYG